MAQMISEGFYKDYAQRYAEVSHGFIQSFYQSSSHDGLDSDLDLITRMQELIAGAARGLDAGCGAGARDVFLYWQAGFDIHGVDAVQENIDLAKELHPEIAHRVSLVDLSKSIDYCDKSFDFVLCNAVIQHIRPELVMNTTLPELARILKHGGILQLLFKVGRGVKTVYDKDYDTDRTFQLYDDQDIVARCAQLDLEIVREEGSRLGGTMFFKDPKPMDHCVFFARKIC